MRPRSGPPPAWADLSCTPAELCEVLDALLAGNDEELAADLAAGQRPIEAVALLVERHRLGCFLASRLEGSPVQRMLPGDLWETICRRRQQQERRSAAILAELRWLLPRFDAAGITVMLLKGPELASRFHGGLHERGYGDLDLLVRGRDRRAALQLLDELGYERRSRVLLSRTLMARVNHGFDYIRQGVRLDLHWCLSRQPGFRIDEDGFWARSLPWSYEGLNVAVPHPQDELHLLLISAFADLQRGALRLQSLLDVKAVIEALQPFQEEAFLATRQQERTTEVCRTMLAIDRALLPGQEHGAEQESNLSLTPAPSRILELLQPLHFGLPAKLWCARRLPVSLPYYCLWWLTSLPLRVAASHPALRPPSASRPAPPCPGT